MKRIYRYYSDLLFARPCFLSGMARTLDLHGDFDCYNFSSTGEEADLRAQACDWNIIRQDLQGAWGQIIDSEQDFASDLFHAIENDATLLAAYKEKLNEFELAERA